MLSTHHTKVSTRSCQSIRIKQTTTKQTCNGCIMKRRLCTRSRHTEGSIGSASADASSVVELAEQFARNDLAKSTTSGCVDIEVSSDNRCIASGPSLGTQGSSLEAAAPEELEAASLLNKKAFIINICISSVKSSFWAFCFRLRSCLSLAFFCLASIDISFFSVIFLTSRLSFSLEAAKILVAARVSATFCARLPVPFGAMIRRPERCDGQGQNLKPEPLDTDYISSSDRLRLTRCANGWMSAFRCAAWAGTGSANNNE